MRIIVFYAYDWFFIVLFLESGATDALRAITLSVIPNDQCRRPEGMFCTRVEDKGICFVRAFPFLLYIFRRLSKIVRVIAYI